MQYYHIGHSEKPVTLWVYTKEKETLEFQDVPNGQGTAHPYIWLNEEVWGRYDGTHISIAGDHPCPLLVRRIRNHLQRKWPHARILEFTS